MSFDPADWIENENESDSSLRDNSVKGEQESQQSHRSQGIYLEATQVPVLTQKPVLLSQVLVEEIEEPDIQEDLQLSSEQREAVSYDNTNIASSRDDEDESAALPLTFNCRADLDRKLKTVEHGLVASSSSSELAQKHKIKSEPNDLAKKIKLELTDNIEAKANEFVSMSGENIRSVTDQTSEEALTLNGEGDFSEGSRTEPSSSIRITTSWSHLLQKPPRLGLSRLERKVNILHEVTILETEE